MFPTPRSISLPHRGRHLSRRAKLPIFVVIAGCLAVPAAAEDDDVERLPEIVVSASRVPVAAEESGSAVTVVTDEEMKRRQTRIVSDVLRDVPGLAVNRSGPPGGLTQLRIRGAEGNQTLVIIDGMEVNNPAALSEFDLSDLLNLDIARLEVLRGPQSALYGSDAVGGVVNVVTAKPAPGLTLAGRGEGGSFGTGEGQATLGYGGQRFYLSGAVDRFSTNGISAADEDNGNTEADGYNNTTARVKLGVRPFDFLELDAVGMLVDSNRESDAGAAVVNVIDSGDRSETAKRYGLAKGKLTLFDGAWEHIARASSISDDTDFFNGTGVKTFTAEGSKTKFDYQTNLFLSTPAFAGAEHTLTLAAEREKEEQFTNSGFFGPNRVQVVNYGYVGEYRVGLWQRLFLSGSIRYDDNDPLFKDEVTYRGTVAYLHEETGTRLHGSVGRGVKNPTLFELFGATPNFVGNPNLTAEESLGWDAGIEQSLFGERLVVDVTYFDNRIDHLIQGSGTTAVNLPGTSRIHGVEVALKAEPLPGLRIDAAYTYTNGEDAAGIELIRRPRHIASVNVNYAFQVLDRPANVNLGVRYNGRQTDTVFLNFFPAQLRTVRLDDFALVNLSVSYEIRPGVELFARVENLLDENYQEVFGFGAPGISAFAGLRVKLRPWSHAGK